MREDLLVSVVMPVYKAKDTVSRAIESILSQSYRNLELIIILEEETDETTRKIIEDYVSHDKRIRCLRKRGNKGVAISLNMGLEVAKGKYIARMDADDYSHTNRLSKQVQYMEEHPLVSVMGSLADICTPYEKYRCELPSDYENIKATMLFYDCLVHPSVMFRKETLIKGGWKYDENCIAEDYELWLRMMQECTIENINESLLDYFYDGIGNTSSDKTVRRNIVRNIINCTYRNIFKSDTLEIPESLTGYDYEMIYWKSNHLEILKVMEFFQELLENNLKVLFCEPKALEDVIMERWNNFLHASYGLRFLKNYSDLFINEITDHSIYKSVALNMEIDADRVIEEVQTRINRLIKLAGSLNDVIVYGVGIHSKKFTEYYSSINVIAYVDQNKQGDIFEDKLIESPNALNNKVFDAIIIATPKYYDEIKKQLIEINKVPEDKIMPVEMLRFK